MDTIDHKLDEVTSLRRDVQILRECLGRIVSYYDLEQPGGSLLSMNMQAKAEHENTMFGAARKALMIVENK